ncbi:hypothetical protein [Arenibacter sp. F20364]|uniref:hypothetical protein n=1 Tax=Arenibacter sp. F20364 TaxID=2926415 RepID=UPI001FF48E2A|nr:hypothetical protein [Arenibacter sp. F20364]MCK0189652.1 hypothetical protein [Arenibacter sp. F20364]
MRFKIAVIFLLLASQLTAKEIFVPPSGSDQGKGSQDSPFASFSRALEEVQKFAGKETVTVTAVRDYSSKEFLLKVPKIIK